MGMGSRWGERMERRQHGRGDIRSGVGGVDRLSENCSEEDRWGGCEGGEYSLRREWGRAV